MDLKKNVYVMYTSQDKALSHNLLRRLQLLENDFNVSIWYDEPIYPEQQWRPQNTSRLDQADIVLLLVSNAFMHSQFIQQIEFKNIIDRYKAGTSTVIPILLDSCPWDIDFNSDDYNFSFTELQVLPEDRNPVVEWSSVDEVLDHITLKVRHVISPVPENKDLEASDENLEEKTFNTLQKEQVAINFVKEGEVNAAVEREKRDREEARAKEIADEGKRLKEETEAKKRVEKEKKDKKEAEAKRITLEEERLKEETEAKRIALEEKKLKEEAEAKRSEKARERKRVEADSFKEGKEVETGTEHEEQEKKTSLKKRVIIGLEIAGLAILGIWAFSLFTSDLDKPAPTTPESKVPVITDSIAVEKPKVIPEKQEEAVAKLKVGATHEGGIIFTIDESGTSGTLASYDDEGPMPWNVAIKIHEKLGKDWRLPTLDELKIMYKTIGQGANNDGEFSDELYWSATPYDTYQARLLKFSNGNASYHYNKAAEHRKFRVRAVRDFSR